MKVTRSKFVLAQPSLDQVALNDRTMTQIQKLKASAWIWNLQMILDLSAFAAVDNLLTCNTTGHSTTCHVIQKIWLFQLTASQLKLPCWDTMTNFTKSKTTVNDKWTVLKNTLQRSTVSHKRADAPLNNNVILDVVALMLNRECHRSVKLCIIELKINPRMTDRLSDWDLLNHLFTHLVCLHSATLG